jgi:hypothetical protein
MNGTSLEDMHGNVDTYTCCTKMFDATKSLWLTHSLLLPQDPMNHAATAGSEQETHLQARVMPRPPAYPTRTLLTKVAVSQ